MAENTALTKRYPGSQPFQREQRRIFFGRNQDIENLFRTVNVNDLTVLYGDSGLGKSSLLNAGVIPRFTEQGVTAVFPRFYGYNKDNPTDPLLNILTQLRQAAKSRHDEHELDELGEETVFMSAVESDPEKQSLWQQVKSILWRQNEMQAALARREATTQVVPEAFGDEAERGRPGLILVFDQFEELFSYPPEMVENFGRAFGELLDNRMPEAFRKKFYEQIKSSGGKAISAEEMAFVEKSLPLKIVLGIRFDRLGMLKQIAQFYPNILLNQNLFRLLPLSREQGREAIVKPAREDGPFVTPRFHYAPETLDAILDYLTEDNSPVDTTQLQIICQYVENKVVTSEDQVVRPEDVGDLREISQNYYNEVIQSLPAGEQGWVQDMVENRLIFEQDHLRLSLYGKQITTIYPGISAGTLESLVGTHLLRVEERSGELIYEISHDALVAPILAQKKIRDDETERQRLVAEAETERQRVLAEAEAERERMMAEAKAQREREAAERQAIEAENERQRLRRQRRTLWRFSLIATALAIVALSGAGLAVYQTHQARDARREAEKQRELAVINYQKAEQSRDTAIQLNNQLLAAQRDLRSATYERRLEQAKNFMDQKRFADALPILEEAQATEAPDRDEAELRALIARCNAEIPRETRFKNLNQQADALRDQKNYLDAYRLYREAQALNFDNADVQPKLDFCSSELRSRLDEELRRAETFLEDGNDCRDASDTFNRFVEPILATLQPDRTEGLGKKSEEIRALIRKRCPRKN